MEYYAALKTKRRRSYANSYGKHVENGRFLKNK